MVTIEINFIIELIVRVIIELIVGIGLLNWVRLKTQIFQIIL